MLTSIYAF